MNIFFFGNTSLAAQNLSDKLKLKNKIYFFSRQKKTKNSFYFDLEKNNKKIFQNLKLKKIDYLFFFSSHVPLNEKKSKWNKLKKVNIFGLVNLLNDINIPIKKIILASSCSVYGDKKNKIYNEECILKPESFYSLSKLTQEKILQVFCSKNNIKFLCYRFGYVFGKKMNDKRLVKRILLQHKKRNKIKIYNKNINLNLIHTDDISYLISKTYKKALGIYNLTNEKKTTLENFYKIMTLGKFSKKLEMNNFSSKKIFKEFHYLKKINLKKKITKFINEN